jgi:hypothetical protein
MLKGGAIENERLLFSLLGISSPIPSPRLHLRHECAGRPQFPNDVLPFSSFSSIPFTSGG